MNYLTTHLKEAILLNQQRAPLYSNLTKGKSDRITKALLTSEKISLPTSYGLDKAASYFQKRDIPVFVHEFIPMNQTPDFKETFEDSLGLTESFPQFPLDSLINDLFRALKKDQYQSVSTIAKAALEDMNKTPKHLCMARHLLESIQRGANLLPIHLQRSQKKNLYLSPKKICHYTIWAQILALKPSLTIDKWAHPLQKDGVPIIFQDVPHIPPMPESYDITP